MCVRPLITGSETIDIGLHHWRGAETKEAVRTPHCLSLLTTITRKLYQTMQTTAGAPILQHSLVVDTNESGYE